MAGTTSDTLTQVFAALADPTRRDMVARLAEGDATVGQLAQPYRMSLQAVYKHLRVLEGAGLVSRPQGPQPRAVRLQTEVFDLMDTWIERHRERVERRYRRLDAVLAEMKGERDERDYRSRHRGRPGAADHSDDA
jgi:DNA-binding transcriptional ArsR family regulator